MRFKETTQRSVRLNKSINNGQIIPWDGVQTNIIQLPEIIVSIEQESNLDAVLTTNVLRDIVGFDTRTTCGVGSGHVRGRCGGINSHIGIDNHGIRPCRSAIP